MTPNFIHYLHLHLTKICILINLLHFSKMCNNSNFRTSFSSSFFTIIPTNPIPIPSKRTIISSIVCKYSFYQYSLVFIINSDKPLKFASRNSTFKTSSSVESLPYGNLSKSQFLFIIFFSSLNILSILLLPTDLLAIFFI